MCNKIKIENVVTFLPDPDKLQLVVFRLTKADGTPYNFVWITGKLDMVRSKLFTRNGTKYERTYLGTIYNAFYPTDTTRIEVNTTKLFAICRDLHINTITIVRFKLY